MPARPFCFTCFRVASSLSLAGLLLAAGQARAQSIESPAPTGWDSPTSTSLRAASRIVNQTSFGPNVDSIEHVEAVGISGYVDEQLNQAPYLMPNVIPAADYAGRGDCNGWACDPEAWWWENVLYGNDQLRQRVAYALSKLFVVSYIEVDPRYFPSYLNTLSRDAFGNWFDLMQDVSTTAAMGTYLNSANSQVAANGHADENFGREMMQLFSIGTVALNQDGSVRLDGDGNKIPNYTPTIVQNFARAFTGYTFANDDCSQPAAPLYYSWPHPPGAGCPMQPLDQYHDTNAKTLLRGQILPSGQDTATDFSAALYNVYQDPSLPPFVCRRLIQNLVKSNPSPAYISRIAAVFIDDGTRTRGNLKAVVRAILLDPEARAQDSYGNLDPHAGLMRDPVLWWTSVLRALSATQHIANPWDGIYTNIFDQWLVDLGMQPRTAPSVFSFYSPDYTINNGSLYAPEFQLENTESLTRMIEHLQNMLDNDFYLSNPSEFSVNLSASSAGGQIAASQGPTALVNALSALLMGGSMTDEMRSSIVDAISGLDPQTMVKNAIFLIVTSPQYRTMV